MRSVEFGAEMRPEEGGGGSRRSNEIGVEIVMWMDEGGWMDGWIGLQTNPKAKQSNAKPKLART